jgi:1-phosphofructokinase family hexose kinase
VIVVGGFNTAIDRFLTVGELRPGGVNRATRASAMPGGKGLHVALTVAALGEPVTLVGLSDSRHGAWFEEFLAAHGVGFSSEPVSTEVRTCLAIRSERGAMTEVLEPGPELDASAQSRLRARFLEAATGARLAVLSGSLPRGLPTSTYADLIDALTASSLPCFLDASGEPLRLGCGAKPTLVKPNRDEAAHLAGAPIRDTHGALEVTRSLAGRGIPRVVLSLGEAGAVASWDGRSARVRTPRVEVRNAVGSGDCLLGGLAVGQVRGLSPEDTLRLGVACGAANASGESTGVVQREWVEGLLPQVAVEWLT